MYTVYQDTEASGKVRSKAVAKFNRRGEVSLERLSCC